MLSRRLRTPSAPVSRATRRQRRPAAPRSGQNSTWTLDRSWISMPNSDWAPEAKLAAATPPATRRCPTRVRTARAAPTQRNIELAIEPAPGTALTVERHLLGEARRQDTGHTASDAASEPTTEAANQQAARSVISRQTGNGRGTFGDRSSPSSPSFAGRCSCGWHISGWIAGAACAFHGHPHDPRQP